MNGSEKQIEWAEQIKAAMLLHAPKVLALIEQQAGPAEKKEAARAAIGRAVARIEREESATWFIGHRSSSPLDTVCTPAYASVLARIAAEEK